MCWFAFGHRLSYPSFITVFEKEVPLLKKSFFFFFFFFHVEQPAWVRAQYESMKSQEKLKDLIQLRAEKEARITIAREKEKKWFEKCDFSAKLTLKKQKTEESNSNTSILDQEMDDSEFLLDNDEDSETNIGLNSLANDSDGALSKQTQQIKEVQIIYSSRTHSQLSQFTNEFKKTRYSKLFNCITLGSRKSLCIHPDVQRKANGNVNVLNDLCMDFQRHKTKKCPYLTKGDLNSFSDHALSEVRDIEDLVVLGEQLKTCPYYGSRQAMHSANLIVVPYPTLVHQGTREALGLSLNDQILMLDEAHNLPETINELHSVVISSSECQLAQHQLSSYFSRYETRLSRLNCINIQQLIVVLSSFNKIFRESKNAFLVKVSEFLFQLAIDNLNLFKLESYLRKSGLCKKLTGFSETFLQMNNTPNRLPNSHAYRNISPLSKIEDFFMKLTHPAVDGRIHFDLSSTSPELKYISLNPSRHVESLFKDTRSVILAGGTLSPISDFVQFLIPTNIEKDINQFSCGHIIPEEYLFAAVIDRDSSQVPIKCAYENQKDPNMV
ncbi:DEAD H (Asp-Glu-Ala-Asp His) box helicase 11 [Coelomomyces lativittatus]|nr:DEAD H (Asp-Glu-Ala-Asp His) box helicase 11 [Coelomomyces lativittatus]